MSTGDGAGVAHVGYSYNGDIEHNTIMFNQTTNPTITTNGGGLLVMGAPDQDPLRARSPNDNDCLSPPGTISPSDGTGPGLSSTPTSSWATLRMPAAAAACACSTSTEPMSSTSRRATPNTNWPTITGHAALPAFQSQTPWNAVQVTNNIIANNVAGWDGGGVSLQDALAVDFVNNTIASNNTTASSGVLFKTLFAPIASTQGNNCTTAGGSHSCPQPAGLVSVTNSAILKANIDQITTWEGCSLARLAMVRLAQLTNQPQCYNYSVPQTLQRSVLAEQVDPHRRGWTRSRFASTCRTSCHASTRISEHTCSDGTQATTGACDDPHAQTSYWDIGVRGDKALVITRRGLSPFYSALSNADQVGGGSNDLLGTQCSCQHSNAMYCNGSRLPVEAVIDGAYGWQVPPGTNETNPLPNTPFTLVAGATVDEGNNWINLRWGPLTPSFSVNNTQIYSFDPHLQASSKAINVVTPLQNKAFSLAPTTDFYGNSRGGAVDIGAVEAPNPPTPTLTSITPSSGFRGQTVPVTFKGTFLVAPVVVVGGTGITVDPATVVVVDSNTVTASLAIAGNTTVGTHGVTITTPGGTSNSVNFTVTNPPAPTVTSITPNTGAQLTTVSVTIKGTNFYAPTISVAGNGQFTVTNVTAVNLQTITATIQVNATATAGSHVVTVSTPGGNATTSFTVTNSTAAPTLSSINPTSHAKGRFPFQVTLTGTKFVAGAVVNLSGSTTGITRGAVTVSADGTQITQNWTITTAATSGVRTVTVQTPAGTTATKNFTIN